MIVMEISRVAFGIALVAFLLLQLFSTFTALVVAFLIMLVSGYVFNRKLHAFSLKIENRFINNFNLRENQHIKNNKVDQLLPWDAHLAHIDMGTHSSLVGKRLEELGLREKYGINIAAIERGNEMLMIPGKNEVLYPFDRISIIGTDEQINNFKGALEKEVKEVLPEDGKTEMSLIQVTVHPGFPFIGKSIRESALREKMTCLIVGIEREGKRLLNPDSSLTFQLHDTLWIVGDKKKVKALLG